MTSLIKFALLQKYKMGVNVSLQKKRDFLVPVDICPEKSSLRFLLSLP